MRFRVFLTHSEKNHEVAEFLAGQLVTQGFTPILAKAVRPTEFPQQLSSKVCVIAIVTPEAVDSPWVNQEIGFALGKVPLIPLVDPRVDQLRLAFLHGAQYVWLTAERIAESTKQIVDWANHLKLKKENKRDLILAACVGALAAVAIYVAIKQTGAQPPTMPTPTIKPAP
jgi:hypothetical protein